MKRKQKEVFTGWTVLNRKGEVVLYEFGDPANREIVSLTKKDALYRARRLAERDDELTCGDINRWESGEMPFAQVRRMGYRVVQASVVVRA